MCWRFDVVTAVLVVSSSTSAVGFKYAGLRHWTGIFYKLRLPAKREEAIRCLGKFEGGGTLVDERGLVVPFDTDLETGRNYTFTPHFEFQRMRIVRENADVKRRAAERKMRRKHKRENHLPEHLWEYYVRLPQWRPWLRSWLVLEMQQWRQCLKLAVSKRCKTVCNRKNEHMIGL
eukprot:CAMPEP_0175969514 /NCGR_PEP_ID=MMETSP0108-20121206/40520_1 /TAXON_ID=195067 ORGANISM="Goniomonas pacifica, Strain CCMP1869" /NCGR_SAMPLE_ID=MMETSP0108 /ASSEMBLY_ACC=CAM_ASM_000204 /LENGTH=174 /DNA_ID=CAMNT_0017298337 /DNA_START=200 /DNA_END=721 /DNA_ORIENTATION=-